MCLNVRFSGRRTLGKKLDLSMSSAPFSNLLDFWVFLFCAILTETLTSEKKKKNRNPRIFHRVLQGAAQRGGAILLHSYGSPDPFFSHMQRNEPFSPLNLHPHEGNPPEAPLEFSLC